MRRLILHIGAHKTGTTALQQSLKVNRARLAAQGAAYVSSPEAAQLHHYLGFAVRGGLVPDGFIAFDAEVLAERLAEADQDLVIASSENFSFFFQRSAIAALERALRPRFDDIRVVCYLRRQDRHAVSHHQEGAKPNRQAEGQLWGHALTALPTVSPNHALYLDYDRRLGLWADVFGADKLDLRVYDRALLTDGDIVADFLALLGLAGAGFAPLGDRNVSLGAAQAKTGHLMTGLAVRPKVMEAILGRIDAGGRLLPSQAEARAFLEPYREGNRRLNARFAVSPLPDLFNDDFSDYPEVRQSDWTEAGATAALQAVLAQVAVVEDGHEGLTVDDLRLAAMALKAKHPDSALRLVTAALTLRPGGKVLQKLKAELDRKV